MRKMDLILLLQSFINQEEIAVLMGGGGEAGMRKIDIKLDL